MQEKEISSQEEIKLIRSEAKLISDFYTGRLNEKGRELLMTLLAQVNQPCFLKSHDEVLMQEVPLEKRAPVVAAEGVKSTEEVDRRAAGLVQFSRRVLEKRETKREYPTIFTLNYDEVITHLYGTSS